MPQVVIIVPVLSRALTNCTGVTAEIQKQVFICLRSWLVAGEIVVSDLVPTQMLEFSFEALASEQLFDEAVDVVCATIHETQEIDDNMDVIQLIIPRVIALKTALANSEDDPDKFKGLARIFAEAGETYRMLILRHPENFIPIIEAIGMCSAYHDLDIAPISFTFWERLAQILGKQSTIPPLFIEAYKNLMMVIIRHLHFPADSSSLTGKEMDDFRSFRHIMGDTLKDCCYVIGTDVCLLAAYDMITAALARGAQVSWQEIEAPLFSLRSMGAEIDTADEVAVPKILDLIPSLPSHPRIQYAALLIISRYTEWINAHPQHVATQIQYVSQGFEIADTDVNAAAGQALKYLCQDCKSVRFPP
jgi:transportin-3